MTVLPPGPRLPRAAQTAAWITRPGPFLMRAQKRYGDVFTIRIGGEPPWVMLADPDAVREVFTGAPAGRPAAHARAQADAAAVPRLAHGRLPGADGADRARADRGVAARRAAPARSTHAGDHARRRAPRDLRRRRRLRPARRAARPPARDADARAQRR